MQLKSSWGDAFRPPPRVLHDLPHPAAGLPGCTEASPGEAAGTRSAHLAAAGGLCRGGVSYAIRVQRAEVKGWRESSCPARGSRAEMHAASGRGWGPGVSQLLHNLSWPQCSALAAVRGWVLLSDAGLKVWPLAARWALLPGPIWAVLGSRGRELESYRETEYGEQGEQGTSPRPYVTVSQGVCKTVGKRSSSLQESSWQKGEWCCGMVLFRMGLECLELPCSSVQQYWLEQRMGRFWCYFLFKGSVSSSDIRALFWHSLQQEAHFFCAVLKVWIGNQSLQCFSISILLSFGLHSPGFLCIEQVLWDKGGLTRWCSCLVL